MSFSSSPLTSSNSDDQSQFMRQLQQVANDSLAIEHVQGNSFGIRNKRKIFAMKMNRGLHVEEQPDKKQCQKSSKRAVDEYHRMKKAGDTSIKEENSESSEMEFGDDKYSDLGCEYHQGDTIRHIKEFDSRLERETTIKKKELQAIEVQDVDDGENQCSDAGDNQYDDGENRCDQEDSQPPMSSCKREQGDVSCGLKVERLSDDVTPDPTTQKNTQVNSPESQSLASNNFDLGSSLLLNDDNESFRDQFSNCRLSEQYRCGDMSQPIIEMINRADSIVSPTSCEEVNRDRKSPININNDQQECRSNDDNLREFMIEQIKEQEKQLQEMFEKNQSKVEEHDQCIQTLQQLLQQHVNPNMMPTTLVTELDIITEQSNDSGTKSTCQTYSFLTRDLNDIADEGINAVYVKSIIENNINSNNSNEQSSTSTSSGRAAATASPSQLKKKETFLQQILSKIDPKTVQRIKKSKNNTIDNQKVKRTPGRQQSGNY